MRGALLAAQTADRPTLIACKTIIGFGAPKLAGTGPAHGGPLTLITRLRFTRRSPSSPAKFGSETKSWRRPTHPRGQRRDRRRGRREHRARRSRRWWWVGTALLVMALLVLGLTGYALIRFLRKS